MNGRSRTLKGSGRLVLLGQEKAPSLQCATAKPSADRSAGAAVEAPSLSGAANKVIRCSL